MKLGTMKIIDRYVGVPVCHLLGFIQRLREWGRGAQLDLDDLRDCRKILLIKFWGMGSIVLSTPLMRSLRTAFPGAEMTVLTFPANREAVELTKLADRVITLEASRARPFLRELASLIGHLRRERYDLVVNLEFMARFSAILTWLSSARARIGFSSDLFPERRWLFNVRRPLDLDLYATTNFLHLLDPGATEESSPPLETLHYSPGDGRAIEEILDRRKILAKTVFREKYVVVVNINASELARERRWPRERFARLVGWLLDRDGVAVVLVSGPEDAAYVEGLVDALPDSDSLINLAGRLTLGQLAALFDRSELCITNDSGPLHVAVAMRTPTVSFFGPETPTTYGPRDPEHTIFYKALPCSPCMKVEMAKTVKCRIGVLCMKEISADEVIEAVESRYLSARMRREAGG